MAAATGWDAVSDDASTPTPHERADEQGEADEAGDRRTPVGVAPQLEQHDEQQRGREHDEGGDDRGDPLADDERPGGTGTASSRSSVPVRASSANDAHRQQRHERARSRNPAIGNSGWITACSRHRSWSTMRMPEHGVQDDTDDVRDRRHPGDGQVRPGHREAASVTSARAPPRRRRGGSGPRGRRPRPVAPRRRPGRATITTTRSHSGDTSASRWVDTSTAAPSSSAAGARGRERRRPVLGSRPMVGSSSTNAGGDPSSAWARPTRWRWPLRQPADRPAGEVVERPPRRGSARRRSASTASSAARSGGSRRPSAGRRRRTTSGR